MRRTAVILLLGLVAALVASPPAGAASPLTMTGLKVATEPTTQACADTDTQHTSPNHAAPVTRQFAAPFVASLPGSVAPSTDAGIVTNGDGLPENLLMTASASGSVSFDPVLSGNGGQLITTVIGNAGFGISDAKYNCDTAGIVFGQTTADFTLASDTPYTVAATTNGDQNSITPVNGRFLLFRLPARTEVGVALSGTLAAGTYELITSGLSGMPDAPLPAEGSAGGFATIVTTAEMDFGPGCAGPGSAPSGGGQRCQCPDPPSADLMPAVQSLRVGLADTAGCFYQRTDSNGNPTGVYEAPDESWIGGFDLRPNGGSLLVTPADRVNPFSSDGPVDLVMGSQSMPAPLPQLHPFVASFTIGGNYAGTFARFVALPLLNAASASVKVSWDPGGAGSKLEASASLDEMSKSFGKLVMDGTTRNLGTASAKVTLAQKNLAPVEVSAGSLQVPEFSVELDDTTPPLKLGFGGMKGSATQVGSTVEWSGEVTTLFPWEHKDKPSQGSLTARLFGTNERLSGLGLAVSGAELPIAKTGWDLTGAEGNVILDPQLAFDVGINAKLHQDVQANPPIPVLAGTLNLRLFRLAKQSCTKASNPLGLVGTINVPWLEAESFGKATLTGQACAYLQGAVDSSLEYSGGLDATLDLGKRFKKVVAVKGSLSGWFMGSHSANRGLAAADFDLEGSEKITLPVIGEIGADGILSSEGYAFCGTYNGISAGVGTSNWVDPPDPIVACDFTPYKVVPPPASRGAGVRAAAVVTSVTVPAGLRGFSIRLQGSAAAPRVHLTGPGGASFDTPAGETALKTASATVIPDDADGTTLVFLRKPKAGVWRWQPATGSSTITSVATSRQVPPPHVTGKVKVRRGKATLTWKTVAAPGERIEFYDRALSVAAPLGRSTASHGKFRFTPVSPLTRTRRIEAVVTLNGMPVKRLVVARYRLAKQKLPGRVKATGRRVHGVLQLKWHRVAGAKTYLVTVLLGRSLITRSIIAGTSTKLPGAPKGKLTMTIAGVDAFGRTGKATTLHVK